MRITQLSNDTLDETSGYGNDTLSDLTIGDSLTLNCIVTTVRGISSSVNIMWYTGGSVVRRVDNLTVAYTDNNSAIYTDLFEIPSLTAIHNRRYYQCVVVINATQRVYSSNVTRLSLSGEYSVYNLCILKSHTYTRTHTIMYTYILIILYIYTHIIIYVYIFMYVHMYVYYIYTYIRMYTHMYVCV